MCNPAKNDASWENTQTSMAAVDNLDNQCQWRHMWDMDSSVVNINLTSSNKMTLLNYQCEKQRAKKHKSNLHICKSN